MRRRKKVDDDAKADMTPMLDVVFILLIFFIVTSTFLSEVGFDLTPPPPSPDANPPKVKSVNIYVDDANFITVDGRSVDISAVRANIERKKAENPETSVSVLSHPDAQNKYVLHVVDQAKLANIANVNVSVAATE
jgi:biopolymer transport protein ExbD